MFYSRFLVLQMVSSQANKKVIISLLLVPRSQDETVINLLVIANQGQLTGDILYAITFYS